MLLMFKVLCFIFTCLTLYAAVMWTSAQPFSDSCKHYQQLFVTFGFITSAQVAMLFGHPLKLKVHQNLKGIV